MNAKNLIQFLLTVHVPAFLVYTLLFVAEPSSNEFYRLLAINWVYLNTACTYIAIYVVPLPPFKLDKAIPLLRIGLLKLLSITSWFYFYEEFFAEYINGTFVYILLYVALITWISFIRLYVDVRDFTEINTTRLQDTIVNLIAVGFGLLVADSLRDCGLLTSYNWGWWGLLHANSVLVIYLTLGYLRQISILSPKTYNTSFLIIMLSYLPFMLYLLLFCYPSLG